MLIEWALANYLLAGGLCLPPAQIIYGRVSCPPQGEWVEVLREGKWVKEFRPFWTQNLAVCHESVCIRKLTDTPQEQPWQSIRLGVQ